MILDFFRKARIPSPSSVLIDLIALKVAETPLDSGRFCCGTFSDDPVSVRVDISPKTMAKVIFIKKNMERSYIDRRPNDSVSVNFMGGPLVNFSSEELARLCKLVRETFMRWEEWNTIQKQAKNQNAALDVLSEMI